MSKAWIWVAVIIIILAGAYFVFANNNKESANTTNDVAPEDNSAAGTVLEGTEGEWSDTNVEVGATISPIKSFTVTASAFKFDPAIIKVKKGDTVKITLVNSGGSHDWKVDEFNAATKVLATGGSETIEFVANKTGSFEYYCSVGTHRAMGMKGTLVVE